MHTVELLDQALRTAERLGYRIRQDWLGGAGGGGCEIKGQKWLFLDLATNPTEQLHVVAEVLSHDACDEKVEMDAKLRGFLTARAA